MHNGKRAVFVSLFKRKSQSAMEYLMTYGWAILIIAVVLGALYSLGIFNGISFAPKASAGSCQVFRPLGPGTAANINLEGECQGLLPQYVAQFNCQNSQVSIPVNELPLGSNPRTMTGWFLVNGNPNSPGEVISYYGIESTSNAFAVWVSTGNWCGAPSGYSVAVDTWGCTYTTITQTSKSTWTFFVVEYTGTARQGYVGINGNIYTASTNAVAITSSSNLYFGTGGEAFNGSIANVQVYNTSIDSNQVAALYREGIGGAPITIQNLIGWWPLNGNANDYSGNNNNGQAINVIYTGSWTSGYRAP